MLALTMGQALVALHGHADAPTQTVAKCSVCRLAAQRARVTAVLVDLLEPHTISIELGATPSCARSWPTVMLPSDST